MPTTKPNTRLMASSPSLEALHRMVDRFFGGCRVLILHEDGRVETGRGVCESFRWVKRGKRYRFEMITA